MSFTRVINFENLSKADKAELRALLLAQKKSLQAALKATNKELADLRHRAKKAKKSKKSKKKKKKK